MEKAVEFLRNKITEKMPLGDIVDVFEQMCKMPIDDDLLLYETGTFDFTGKPLFYICLVRQFPNDYDEFFQIHVDIHYNPDKENDKFQEFVWNDSIDENFFDYIKNSEAFAYAKNKEYVSIDIFMDET